MTNGGISDTFGGEIDALPTLEHLLGIEANNYLQVGQDMLSSEHSRVRCYQNRRKLYHTKIYQL